MGSSIEGACVFTLVLLVLSFLIVAPSSILLDCAQNEYNLEDELSFHLEDDAILQVREYDGYTSNSISCERMHTLISGASYSYRMIYNCLAGTEQ